MNSVPPNLQSREVVENVVLGQLMASDSFIEKAKNRLDPKWFLNPVHRAWVEEIFHALDKGKPVTSDTIPAMSPAVYVRLGLPAPQKAGDPNPVEYVFASACSTQGSPGQELKFLDELEELDRSDKAREAAEKFQSRLQKGDRVRDALGEFQAVVRRMGGGGDGKKLGDIFREAALTLAGIDALSLPKREPIIEPWCFENGLGYIYGPRGVGKTWLASSLAASIATGKDFGPWTPKAPRKVLYLDGEMPLDASRERFNALLGGDHPNLVTLHHEAVWHIGERSLCLSDPDQQREIIVLAERIGARVIIADNLSTLLTGVRENEGDDWAESMLPFLLELRRRRIAVVLLHHAGRNGQMRGTSKREDMADWILSLTAPEDGAAVEGARFISTFTKNRHAQAPCPPLDWCFQTVGGAISVTTRTAGYPERLVALVEAGLTSCGDLAQELGISKGQASKVAAQLIGIGKLVKDGRDYRLPAGKTG